MALPATFDKMRLPLIGAPMFIVSGPELVIAQCKAGIVGTFPALNAREKEGEPIQLEEWLVRIKAELAEWDAANPDKPAAPFGVNLIAHRTNERLQRDVEILMKHEVPIWITSLGARPEINEAAHSVGAVVLHDVIHNAFAKKAIEKGADGLIAVAAGAGGHAGLLSPFALVQEIREWFDGPLFLSGAMAHGRSILAAKAMGADGGYMGTAFIATEEGNAVEGYKQMIVESSAQDIMYSDFFTGVHGNYLRPSIEAAGLDPDNLTGEKGDVSKVAAGEKSKAWRDIWGSGQGIGVIRDVPKAGALIARLEAEYDEAKAGLCKS
ncbi:NAD(P)H-dependent flavin oxidoreductase [Maritimibacter dapengensis]|uniref:Nitronate monooxygenase family protein n=1 Tax=Maritimibacter dapengensis TaxID=2836868 RepID=A0ABS6T657_9RHOB|nr:nitronate monooxygenase family protein [Maritimibacter dapengensis]MBV7380751.1 nitronate monooxygenase family protein [Maritimibacter dapengensis]